MINVSQSLFNRSRSFASTRSVLQSLSGMHDRSSPFIDFLRLAARSFHRLLFSFNVRKGWDAARLVRRALNLFRQVVLEPDKPLPFVAVGIADPRLVLHGVTACRVHLLAMDQTSLFPTIL